MPALEARLDQFRAAGAALLGINCDSTWSHDAWARHERLSYPLLSDVHRTVCRAYGVLNPDRNAPRRSTFIVDRDGIVRFREVYGAGELPDADTLLAAVRAIDGGGQG